MSETSEDIETPKTVSFTTQRKLELLPSEMPNAETNFNTINIEDTERNNVSVQFLDESVRNIQRNNKSAGVTKRKWIKPKGQVERILPIYGSNVDITSRTQNLKNFTTLGSTSAKQLNSAIISPKQDKISIVL